MRRINNKVYCTDGQAWDSVSLRPSGQMGKRMRIPQQWWSRPFDWNHPLRHRAPKLYRGSDRDWLGQTASRLWQGFSVLVASVVACWLAADMLPVIEMLSRLFSMCKPCFAKSAFVSVPEALAGRLRIWLWSSYCISGGSPRPWGESATHYEDQ